MSAFALLRDDFVVGAGSAVDAGADVSAEAALSFDFLDFFVGVDSGALAAAESPDAVSGFELFFDFFPEFESADDAAVADDPVSSDDFFFLDDFVDDAVSAVVPVDVSAELAALLLFFDFDFEVSDGAAELSEEVVSDFFDFFDFFVVVVDD